VKEAGAGEKKVCTGVLVFVKRGWKIKE